VKNSSRSISAFYPTRHIGMHNAGMRRALQVSLVLILAGGLLLVGVASSAQTGRGVVDVIQVHGLIDPPTAAYLEDRIRSQQGSSTDAAIVVELDSAGGLVDSMARLVQQMENSSVPVVVWVAPRGAAAGGAATLLLSAGDLAYMAGETRLGSVVPVNLNSATTGGSGASAVDLLRRLSSLRNRNLPGELTRPGASISSAQAAQAGFIDGVASSLADVLRKMDGLSVSTAGGETATLETWNQATNGPSVGFRFEEMNLIGRALHSVTSPEIAFLLLLVGAFGLIFEIYNPGIGLAAMIGIGALAGSFYALNVLPTDWLGVLVVLIAVGLFVVDVQLSGFGIWSAGGVIGLVAGGLLMFSGAPSAARLSPWAIVIAVVISLLFFVSVMTAALRVRLRRPITGEEGIVGTVGEARTDIAPEGTVFTKGKLWRARTMETGIAAGSSVQIKATEGLVLLVEPVSEHDRHAPIPGAGSETEGSH
jgi:membrane-bound serine protease (ClpP class)